MGLRKNKQLRLAKLGKQKKYLKLFLFIALASYLLYFNLAKFNINHPENTVTYTLPSDPKDLLKGPPKDATEEYKMQFFKLITQHAQEAETLELTSCQPSPFILKVENKSIFSIQNNGPETLVLELTQAHGDTRFIYMVPTGKTALTADFGKGPGAYAYYCNDNSAGAVGIILVT